MDYYLIKQKMELQKDKFVFYKNEDIKEIKKEKILFIFNIFSYYI